MFATLRLVNIGPHLDRTLTLDPAGSTTVRGPSGSGKSSIPAAVAALLWGTTINQNDAAPTSADQGAVVEGVTAKGSTLTRRGNRYSFAKRGQPAQHFASFQSYAQIVGEYARRADVGLFVTIPHAADDFYTRDRGRTLRDALTAVLGADDIPGIVAALMGEDSRPSDPAWLEGAGGALAAQTAANRGAALAEGALRGAQEAVTRATDELARVTVPSDAEVEAANRTIADATIWDDHGAATQAYNRAHAARELAEQQARDYDARRAALGDRPVYDPADLMAARLALQAAEASANAERKAERDAEVARLTAEAVERARVEGEAQARRAAPRGQVEAADDGLTERYEPEPYDPNWQNPMPPNLALVRVQCGAYGPHIVGFDPATRQAEAFDNRRIGKAGK